MKEVNELLKRFEDKFKSGNTVKEGEFELTAYERFVVVRKNSKIQIIYDKELKQKLDLKHAKVVMLMAVDAAQYYRATRATMYPDDKRNEKSAGSLQLLKGFLDCLEDDDELFIHYAFADYYSGVMTNSLDDPFDLNHFGFTNDEGEEDCEQWINENREFDISKYEGA